MFGRKRECPVSESALREVLARRPVFAGLRGEDRFIRAAAEFARTRAFSAAGGAVLTSEMIATVSALAVLPVWRIGMEWLDDWRGVVMYPDAFVAPARRESGGWDDGVVGGMTIVSEGMEERAGEAMEGGPIVLSWEDVLDSGWASGFNVAAHEIAHKLDMRNGGEANGFPPLHPQMSRARWTETMERAFADLERRLETDRDAPVDDGAADDAGEFFAACAESFFETPNLLRAEWPEVYAQLRDFYMQNPAERLAE